MLSTLFIPMCIQFAACPPNRFGAGCEGQCSCKQNATCDSVTGGSSNFSLQLFHFHCVVMPTLKTSHIFYAIMFVSGACDCPAGWRGSICDRPCHDGFFGKRCTQRCDCGQGSSHTLVTQSHNNFVQNIVKFAR